MLVLSRKTSERILIGDDILVQIVRINATTVRVGILAPRGMAIVREELLPAAPSLDLATLEIATLQEAIA